MRLSRLIPTLVLTGLLAACAPTPAPSGRGDGDVWRSGEDLSGWGLSPDESDNVTVTLGCKSGSGRVKIERPVAANWRGGALTAGSGDAAATWPARFQEDGEIMEGWAVAEASTLDPVLTAFAETGRLTLDGVALDAVDDAERKAIADFFKGCM